MCAAIHGVNQQSSRNARQQIASYTAGRRGVARSRRAGSVVVIHDHLPHYSSHNYFEWLRHALSLHVKAGAAKWSQRNWLHRKILQTFRL